MPVAKRVTTTSDFGSGGLSAECCQERSFAGVGMPRPASHVPRAHLHAASSQNSFWTSRRLSEGFLSSRGFGQAFSNPLSFPFLPSVVQW